MALDCISYDIMVGAGDIRQLIKKLEALCKQISQGKYESSDVRGLFSITSGGKFPKELAQLAESFSMMMVKVEAREYHLASVITELEEAKTRLVKYSHQLEDMVAERTEELQAVNAELGRLANLDGLTRISNRRLFDEYLPKEWSKSRKTKTPLSLIMADVDCFKSYNDTYGHQIGDECLKAIADTLMGVFIGSSDLVARYGGEEFVVVLPNTPPEEAFKLAEDVRDKVESLRFEHLNSTAGNYVTISSGVSCIRPEEKGKPEMLIEQADKALYIAKKEKGRNSCVLYGAENQ